MPSLLLKRTFKTEFENEEEKLQKGNEYKKMEADMNAGTGTGYGKVRRILQKGVKIPIFIIF